MMKSTIFYSQNLYVRLLRCRFANLAIDQAPMLSRIRCRYRSDVTLHRQARLHPAAELFTHCETSLIYDDPHVCQVLSNHNAESSMVASAVVACEEIMFLNRSRSIRDHVHEWRKIQYNIVLEIDPAAPI